MERVEVNTRYLSPEVIVEGKINILKSICGTGKTTAVSTFLDSLPFQTRVLIPTFRRSLCSFLTTLFSNVTSYLDCKEDIIDCDLHPRICISPESFPRYKDSDGHVIRPGVIIWDEFCSFLEHIVNLTTISGFQRNYFIRNISSFFRNPNVTVIICDAYFEEETDMQIVQLMAGIGTSQDASSRIRFVNNRYYEKKVRLYSYHKVGATEWKKRYFHEINQRELNTYVFSNSKSLIEGLEREYREMLIEKKNRDELDIFYDHAADTSQLVTSASSDKEKEYFSSLPDESWTARVFMVSPTIQAGVSFTNLHYTNAFGYAIHGSSSVLALCQQIARVRNLLGKEVHLMLPPFLKVKSQELNWKEEELSVDKVWSDIAKYESWTGFKIQQLMDFHILGEKDRNVFDPDARSVLNSILVRVLYNKTREKLSFVKEFKRYTKNDWYDFIDVEPWDLMEYEDPAILYMRNIMNTFEQAKKFRLTFWENLVVFEWDGRWPGDDWLKENKGGALDKWLDFANEWNIFGTLGKITDLKEPHFNPARVAHFATQYCNPECQRNFHKLLFQTNASIIDKDSLENRFNSFQFDGLLYSGIGMVLAVFNVFNCEVTHIGTGVSFFDGSVCKLVSTKLPVSFIAKEENINHAFNFEYLCKELDRCYSHMVRTLDIKMLTHTQPKWLIDKVVTPTTLKDMRRILDAVLKFLGLYREKKPLKMTKVTSITIQRIRELNRHTTKENKHSTRLRCRSYTLNNIKERVMISFSKVFKTNKRGVLHPNHFVPDPFVLLDFTKAPKHVESFSYEENHTIFGSQYKVWPLRDNLISRVWFDEALIWGKEYNHWSQMTHDGNILDRFDFWNPLIEEDLYEDNLPGFFTKRTNAIRELTLQLPLRKWPDYPF